LIASSRFAESMRGFRAMIVVPHNQDAHDCTMSPPPPKPKIQLIREMNCIIRYIPSLDGNYQIKNFLNW